MGTHVSTIEAHKSCLVQKKDLYRGIFSFRHYLSVSQVINVLYKEVFFLIFRHYQLVNQVKWSLLHLRMDVLLHYGRVVQNQRLNIIQSINQTQRKGRLKFYSSQGYGGLLSILKRVGVNFFFRQYPMVIIHQNTETWHIQRHNSWHIYIQYPLK